MSEHWDDHLQSMVIKETENWIVSVTPMLFNDRVLLTQQSEYSSKYPGYTSGWCYDKGGAAVLAARVFDPDTEHEPVGYKKAAFDGRKRKGEVYE